MAIVNLIVTDVNDSGNRIEVVGSFQVSNAPAGYVNPGTAAGVGELLDFSKAVNSKLGDCGLISSEAPLIVQITSRSSGSTVNYLKDPTPPAGFGPRRDKGGIRFFALGAGVELVTGNYPAGALADTFDFWAEFRKAV